MAEIIGSAAIEIKAKDKNFENEVRKIASKIKKVEVPVDAVVNTDLAKKQLEAFRKSQQGRKVKLYAEVDTRSAATTLNKFIKAYQGTSKQIKLGVDVDTDSVLEAATLLDDFKEQYHDSTVDIGVEVDKSVKDDIEDIKRTTDGIGHSLNRDLRLDVNSAGANAQLLATAAIAQATRRAISAPMKMNIDQETLAGIKGFFYTITGGIPIDKVKSTLMGLSANFEGIAVKTGIVSSSVLSLAGTLSHAVGDLLTIGGDVTQVVGLLNAAPAGIAAGGLALTGTILGWKGFGEALMGEGKEAAKAMKLLPPEAQKAVKALDGMGSSIRTVTQTSYWRSMGTAVQDVSRAITKDLHEGMENAGGALGGQMAAIFGSIQEFGESGGLRNTFDDLTEFFKTSTPALAGFTSGFLDLMEGGAREMPAFGTWLSKLGTGFADWAKEANESGAINIWIQEATQRMKELGKVGQATYGMFSGLTAAARNAGMNGLTDLASGMVDVSNAMNSPGFQKGLTSFFTSTRVGAANALPGVQGFFEMIGDGLPTINEAMEISGTVTGNMFKNFTRMFENGNLGKGFLQLLRGMQDGTEVLTPGFEHLGNALGGLMEVGGEVIRNVAPGLNQLFETVDVVVNNMKDGIIAALPVFNEFIQGLLAGVRSVIGPLASLAGTMLSAFANLPGPIQTALMSIGGFLGAAALIKNKMKDSTSSIGAFATGTQNRMRNMATSVADSARVVSRAYGSFDPSKSRAFIGPQTLAQTNSNMQKLVDANRTTAQRIQGIWATADLKREQIDQKAQARRAANKFQSQQVNQTGIGGQILPLTGRNSFDKVSAAAKTASAKAANSLSTIGKTAGVVGGQITRGLGSAVSGLTGALGGPWGLAITGAIAGMAAMGNAASEQKQKIEDFYQTFDESGKATSATTDQFAKRLYSNEGTFWDKLDGLMMDGDWGGTKVSSILDDVGLSADEVAQKMTTMGSEYSDAWSRIQKATHGGLNSGEQALKRGLITQEDLDMVGLATDKVKELSGTKLNALSSAVTGIGNQFQEAGTKAEKLRQDMEKMTQSQVMDNKVALESVTSSVEEKMAAFKSNLKLGNLEQLSSQAGFYQLGQVTEQNTSKLQAMNNTMKESGKTLASTVNMKDILGTNVAMFEMNTQAGRQMFEVVSSQANGIHTAMMSSYDTVLKQTGDLEQAQSSALQTAQKEVGAFRTELENIGLDKSTIDGIIDTAGLSDLDITMALKTEGIDEAISQAMAVEAAIQGLQSGNWTMTFDVMTDDAQAQITNLLGLAETASSQEIVQSIRAQFENSDEYNSWMVEFNQAVPEKRIKMLAELNADSAKSSIESILADGETLNGKTWKAKIEATAEGAKASVDQVNTAINSIPPETLAKITADVEGDPSAKLDAILGSKEFKAAIKAVVEGDPAGEIESKVPKNTTATITPEVQPIAQSALLGAIMPGGVGAALGAAFTIPPPKIDPIPPQDVAVNFTVNDGSLGAAKSSLDSIADKNVSVNVQANESGLANLKSTMDSLTDKTVNVTVNSNDSGVSAIRDTMNSLTDKTVNITVNANDSGIGAIRDTMNSLTDKTVNVNVKANSGGIQQIQSAMSSLVNKTVSVNIKANAGPINAVKSAMASIVSKSITVTTNASTGPVNALKTAINSIANKTVTITANAPTAAVNALKAAIGAVNGKTVSVTANTNTGAVYGLISAINAVRGKTVTVTVRTNRVGAEADGGIYTKGIKTYARGGFDDPRIARAIERANRRGGSENHTAQIARGSNNYRVWGEPETGGEAYIPLAMSKRARSLKILEQVASHFGMTLERFAEGGILSGNKVSSNVTTFASGGTTKKTKASAKAKEAEKKRKSDLKELNKTIKESIKDLKKALSDGLSDLKSAFGQADRSPVQKALDGMRKGVRDFKSETTKQIAEAKKLKKSTKAMSAQLKASTKVDKDITKQMYSSKVWNRKGSNLQDSRYIAKDARSRQKDRRVDYNSKFTLRDYERAIGYVNDELEKQEDKYKTMVKNHTSNMESISGNLFKQFDLGSLVNSKDEFGYRPPTTARDISSYASKMLSDMRKLSSNLSALRKAGYNEAIINQISQMGLEEALVVSQALISDKSQMKSLNSSYSQMFGKRGDMFIDPKTGELGFDPKSLVAQIGKTGADAMFKAGNSIQKGIVDGLTADVKALEKAGQTMADAIHKGYTKKLKINSPSKLFRETSKAIPEGVVQGIDSGRGMVDSSIGNLVQPKRLNLTTPSSRTTNSSGIINGNGGTNPVVVNIHPSEGMSERQIGTTAAREIHYRMDSSF